MIAAAMAVVTARAQWLDYPTPGVPRLPNGKPDYRRAKEQALALTGTD